MTQIITTSFTTAGNNVVSTTGSEFIYIAEDVTRASTTSAAVWSGGFFGTQVQVLGSLVGFHGIFLRDDVNAFGQFDVTISTTGSVVGESYGIYLENPLNTVTNQGEITGYEGGIFSGGADFQLTNSGTITSHGGNAVWSIGSGSDIVNYGLIQSLSTSSSTHAVDFSFSDNVTLTNYGTLSAASGTAVRGAFDGVDKISNFGLINGDVLQQGGSDFFRNGGQVVGDVDLGTGNDVFRGGGGTVEGDIIGGDGNDTIIGGNSDNVILGGKGNDVLRGAIGEDTIAGGGWVDVMTGGADADIFDFNAVTDSGTTAADRDLITDFQKGLDLIDLSTIDANAALAGNQAFTFIGASAFSAAGQVRAVQQGGNTVVLVSSDADTAAEMTFTLDGLFTLTVADFVL